MQTWGCGGFRIVFFQVDRAVIFQCLCDNLRCGKDCVITIITTRALSAPSMHDQIAVGGSVSSIDDADIVPDT